MSDNHFFETNPFLLFEQWKHEAESSGALRPESMVLATATKDGLPSARVVLLKQYDERGFVFFTNLSSRKGQELHVNPHAALCIYWPIIEKQIRIEGKIELISADEADLYYNSRPKAFQINSWASKQSAKLVNFEQLQSRTTHFETLFKNKHIPRPEFWSGFRLAAQSIEFWNEGQNRMHTRILYVKQSTNWDITLLYP
ncbi:Pyridoxine/pyridoxamine 5'-phosphate oxidase [Rickettsiales bacterium Ac37b]|nr:Pyridoxine/pyridoxamine 5'-phosphate oxidase [Rickettsiales bacterium Ac37b]